MSIAVSKEIHGGGVYQDLFISLICYVYIRSCRLGKILTTPENMGTGTVESYTYHTYVKAAGGYFVAVLVMLTLFLNVGSSAFSSWWLAMWIKAGGGVNIFFFS